MTYLVDTNVLSELRKGPRADRGVRCWFAEVEGDGLFLSVMTVGELWKGIDRLRRRDPRGADALETWLDRVLAEYGDRVLPISGAVARQWARLNVPDPLPVVDGLIAATALVQDLTIVSRNLKDMERSGARCLNPFEHG